MRGLVILFMTLTLNQISMAKASNGIFGSDIPVMRTGFSLTSSASDTFNRACRNMVNARFAETISEANPEEAARIAGSINAFIPPAEFAAATQENTDSVLARMQAAAIQVIKPKLSPSLRNTVPEGLVLLSGFTPGKQDPLDMAGCYIRLGNNLRSFGLTSLASTSFLNSGTIYAEGAMRLSRFAEYIANHESATDTLSSDTPEQDAGEIADLRKSRVDMLISAAQNFYWAYCNEARATQKATIRTLTEQYFTRANTDAALLSAEEQTTWLAKIASERTKLLSYAG